MPAPRNSPARHWLRKSLRPPGPSKAEIGRQGGLSIAGRAPRVEPSPAPPGCRSRRGCRAGGKIAGRRGPCFSTGGPAGWRLAWAGGDPGGPHRPLAGWAGGSTRLPGPLSCPLARAGKDARGPLGKRFSKAKRLRRFSAIQV